MNVKTFSIPSEILICFGIILFSQVYLELPNGEELAQALYSKVHHS